MSGNDAVFQNIRFSRSKESAKYLLGEQTQAVVISDQFSSYNWIDSSRHPFCLAHVVRNRQQMADYAGQGLTAYIGRQLTLLMWLKKGAEVPISQYAGRCQHILKYEQGLWVFLHHPNVPLTNNEAERCLRGSVIMRKICYGTSSDSGEKFRSRVFSVAETCRKLVGLGVHCRVLFEATCLICEVALHHSRSKLFVYFVFVSLADSKNINDDLIINDLIRQAVASSSKFNFIDCLITSKLGGNHMRIFKPLFKLLPELLLDWWSKFIPLLESRR